MKKNGIIKRSMFTMCLGNNGGYLQFGGYDKKGFNEEVSWIKPINTRDWKVEVEKMTLGKGVLPKYSVGFIDSGTSFAYFPGKLDRAIKN